jgi:hypothetical protein
VFDGAAFVPVWSNRSAGPVNAQSMVAASDHEVWVSEQRDGEWFVWRWFDGRWSVVGGPWEPRGFFPIGAAASDGAVWMMTPDGTTRFASEVKVVDDATSEVTASMDAGDHGRMGVMVAANALGPALADPGRVLLIGADGTTTDLGVPPIPVAGFELAVAGDEAWVASTNMGPFVLVRWNGAWEEVVLPAPDIQVMDIAATEDGAVWVGYTDAEGAKVARYADSAWTTFVSDSLPMRPLMALDGSVLCAVAGASHSCFDESGPVPGPEVLDRVPASTNEVQLAPDGTVWVFGEDVVRVGQV